MYITNFQGNDSYLWTQCYFASQIMSLIALHFKPWCFKHSLSIKRLWNLAIFCKHNLNTDARIQLHVMVRRNRGDEWRGLCLYPKGNEVFGLQPVYIQFVHFISHCLCRLPCVTQTKLQYFTKVQCCMYDVLFVFNCYKLFDDYLHDIIWITKWCLNLNSKIV